MLFLGTVIIVSLLFPTVLGQRFDPRSHKNWDLLASQRKCGRSAQQRIIGGRQASLGQFPWMVRIGYKMENADYSRIAYSCGGSLINKNYVLTASHCTVPKRTIDHVRLGENHAHTALDCYSLLGRKICAPPVQDIPVARVIPHEHFSYDKNMKNDIALLRLAFSAVFNNYVQPICIPYGRISYRNFKNEMTTVAGWGLTEKKLTSDFLLSVDQRVTDIETCRKKYKEAGVTLASNNDAQICVGGLPGKDSCNGDSGGPLMWVGSGAGASARTFLLGIVSMGPTECGIHIPGVYTRISYYLKWILDNMEL